MEKRAVEIERTYLLNRLPGLPAAAEQVRIEQGYFSDEPGSQIEGRIRRTIHPDGRIICTHTIKRGEGLVRHETERTIPSEEFERLWPETKSRRLRKTRWTIREGDMVWEVDAFEELDLVLAEVELTDEKASVTLPDWLRPHVVREVTNEKDYRNYELALSLARLSSYDDTPSTD